jgi:hypothetical protein
VGHFCIGFQSINFAQNNEKNGNFLLMSHHQQKKALLLRPDSSSKNIADFEIYRKNKNFNYSPSFQESLLESLSMDGHSIFEVKSDE